MILFDSSWVSEWLSDRLAREGLPRQGRDPGSLEFDSALEARIAEDLKQAAIEEGQWNEKREVKAEAALAELKARINAGRDRLAAEKKAALARGEEWR